MSREWERSTGVCNDCGNTGSINQWSDDWNRWGVEWKGFTGSVTVLGERQNIRCKKCGSENVSFVRIPAAC